MTKNKLIATAALLIRVLLTVAGVATAAVTVVPYTLAAMVAQVNQNVLTDQNEIAILALTI